MKKTILYLFIILLSTNLLAQKYDASDKYWLPQECRFNLQDKELRLAESSNKNVSLSELIQAIFKGKNIVPTKLTILCNSKVKYIETSDEIIQFDILSPAKIEGSSPTRFDLADYLLLIEGKIGEKPTSNILIYVSNASGLADKSMYRNFTVLSDIWSNGKMYGSINFLVAYDYQTREEGEAKFNATCLPILEKTNSNSNDFSDLEFMILEKRNANLLYKTGQNYTEFDQNRDAIATFIGCYNRLCCELTEKGYNDHEKMHFTMLLANDIANNYIKIGKNDLAYQYLYHCQDMARQLNEYKYTIEYLKNLSEIERATQANFIANEMKTKGLDISDAATYKILQAIK